MSHHRCIGYVGIVHYRSVCAFLRRCYETMRRLCFYSATERSLLTQLSVNASDSTVQSVNCHVINIFPFSIVGAMADILSSNPDIGHPATGVQLFELKQDVLLTLFPLLDRSSIKSLSLSCRAAYQPAMPCLVRAPVILIKYTPSENILRPAILRWIGGCLLH
ncbi:hypothetical protein NEOLEDRAFT_476884 [Neolentinus lepideus HHB14362 ss-1]|uniref:F-box domain-containing protein n=1 Tax=Neolentinus lepideus HHB14362 ss-1 TaxID=1314782 RepID=A0A165VKN2_9AGAM|nr:hypothetical protein NEOLEDRAFT_476884 [Neolentinus lepideus HHB14362 ss-1]